MITFTNWIENNQSPDYIIRRKSDGRYYAPIGDMAWRWHKDYKKATPLYLWQAQKLIDQELHDYHRDNWRYDIKKNPLLTDKEEFEILNFNSL